MSLLMDGLGAPALLLISFFLAVTAVLWLLLPFSIFGIKAKLDEQLRVLRNLDRNIERLRHALTEKPRPPEAPGTNGLPEAEAPPPQPELSVAGDANAAHSPKPPQDPDRDDRWQKP